MFNLEKFETTYNKRKRDNLFGFTCISKYPKTYEHEINKINNELLLALDKGLYEAYDKNLHLTLIGLNENILFKSQRIGDFIDILKIVEIEKINLKLLENGLLIIEISLDDKSRKLLVEYRNKFENLGFEYKHKDSISVLHSVLGIFNFNTISEKTKEENESFYKILFNKVQELNNNLESFSKKRLDLNPQVVEFNNTELKNDYNRYCRELDLVEYNKTISHLNKDDDKSKTILEFISNIKIDKEIKDEDKVFCEKIVFVYENKLFKNEDYVKTLSNIDSINSLNQYWQVINLKILLDKIKKHEEYNFTGYSFPTFIEKSFDILKTDKIIFDKEVKFLHCKFHGVTKFNDYVFEKKVSFNLAKFYKETQIKSSKFKGETYFRKTYFFNKIDFEAANFKNVSFDGITFPEYKKKYKEPIIIWISIIITLFSTTSFSLSFSLVLGVCSWAFLSAVFKSFKEDEDVYLKMTRTTFDKAIWTDFINASDVTRIKAERETLAVLKKTNSERGNYIDSNLFFAAESDKYLTENIGKIDDAFKYNYLGIKIKEDANKKFPKSKVGTLLKIPDIIAFGFAKLTNNYGTNWIYPLFYISLILIFANIHFKVNVDFISTEHTPKYLLEEDCIVINNKEVCKKEPKNMLNINKKYYEKNYYKSYLYDFQSNSIMKLKNDWYISIIYLVNSSLPSFIVPNQWFVSIDGNKKVLKIILNILLVYLIGAFILALKNRTSRG